MALSNLSRSRKKTALVLISLSMSVVLLCVVLTLSLIHILLLLDVMMPGTDGFSLCRKIRDQVDCPILFVTAKTDEADLMTGLGIGGDDYITKPFRCV